MSDRRDLSDRPNPAEQWQKVQNENWPALEVAKRLKDVPAAQAIDVVARIVFETDGEQYLHGRAVRWTRDHVCVSISDRRLQVSYVWLNPADVRRRGEQDPA